MVGKKNPKAKVLIAGPENCSELTIVCTCELVKVKGGEAKMPTEMAALLRDPTTWSPRTDDFLAIADTPNAGYLPRRPLVEVQRAETVGTFLTALREKWHYRLPTKPALGPKDEADKYWRSKKSLSRINIIGHGQPGLLGLYSTVDFRSGATFLGEANSAEPSKGGGLDMVALEWLNNDEHGHGPAWRDQIRERLTPDAEIHIFCCHMGVRGSQDENHVNEDFMVALADTFLVWTYGFPNTIGYKPSTDTAVTTVTDRRWTFMDRREIREQVGETREQGYPPKAVPAEHRDGPVGLGYGCLSKPEKRDPPIDGQHLVPEERFAPIQAIGEASGAAIGIAPHSVGRIRRRV